MTPTRKTKSLAFFIFLLPALGAPLCWVLAFPVGSLPGLPACAFLALLLLYSTVLSNAPWLTVLVFAITGLLSTLAGALWLAAIHPAALLLAAIYKTFWFSLAGALWSLLLRIKAAPFRIIAFALLWVMFDAVHHWSAWSFPYLCLPYSFAASRAGLTLAGLGSLYFVSFVAALIAGTLAELGLMLRAAIQSKQSKAKPWLLMGILAMLCLIALFLQAPAKHPQSPLTSEQNTDAQHNGTSLQDTANTLTVALIQPNHYAFEPSFRDYDMLFERLSALTTQALTKKPDLIIWHETAVIPPVLWYRLYFGNADSYAYSLRVLEFIKGLPVPLLTGMTWIDYDDRARELEYNAAVFFERDKAPVAYKKMRLVPFAEYFPFTNQFPSITRSLIRIFGPLRSPGTEPVTFEVKGFTIAAPICFEDSYTSVFAQFSMVDTYIVLTEDSWSKSLAMKRQHLAMSQLRAVETGMYVLRASNTGLSAVIGPDGSILAQLPTDTEGILMASVHKSPRAKNTKWFTIVPAAAFLLETLILLLHILWTHIEKKRNLQHTERRR